MPNEWGTAGLVPGIQIRLTSRELAEHLRGRAAYHKRRGEEKAAELPKIEEAVNAIKAQTSVPVQTVAQSNKGGPLGFGGSNYRFDGDDTVDALKRDIEDHRNKAVAFGYLAEHLFEQDYCLSRHDLVSLEILK